MMRASTTRAPFAHLACIALLVLALLTAVGCTSAPTADGTPADGSYQVTLELEGGSGRATVESPAEARVEDGRITLEVVWSSSNYDLMVVDGVEYAPTSTEDGSTFEIAVPALEGDVAVEARTTAMGDPHLISYTLHLGDADDEHQGASTASDRDAILVADFHNPDLGCGWEPVSSLDLSHAKNFTVDDYEGGYRLICIADGSRYLLVPEGKQAPEGLASDIRVIAQQADQVYLVSSAVACLVDKIDALDHVAATSVTPQTCSVERLKDAIEDGSIPYAGRYNTPDYEVITEAGCTLAVENTMIYHTPEVREKLEDLGVTVLTELSSRETEVLGRLEWVKLFGVLFGRESEATSFFDEACERIEQVSADEPSGKTVAFFYINSNGAAVTRRSNDYVSQMVGLAGGTYLFSDLPGDDGTSSSTVTVEMEQFYAMARDADIIIYNGTTDDSIDAIDDLVAKNPLLAQFHAVQNGQVWICNRNMYQQMADSADIIEELHAIVSGNAGQLAYFRKIS